MEISDTLHETEDEMVAEGEESLQIRQKKKRYTQKFNAAWLSDKIFKEWLEKKDGLPFCKTCKTSLSCARTALVRHCESKAHKESITMGKEIAVAYKPLTSMFTSKSEPARLEIKTCAFVVEKNLPISMADDMIRFMKSLFPNNDVLQHVSLGKQKSTN